MCMFGLICVQMCRWFSKGERQLPFTAPGDNKGGRRGSYLGSFIGVGGREGLVFIRVTQ